MDTLGAATGEPNKAACADLGALEFHLREHASLRAEIESDKLHIRKLEMYTVLGAGGVWSWLALNPSPALRLGWFVPLLFGFFGLFQTMGVVKDIVARAEYLRSMEETVHRLGKLQGWETFLKNRRGEGDPSVLNWIFWGSFLVVAGAVPFLVFD